MPGANEDGGLNGLTDLLQSELYRTKIIQINEELPCPVVFVLNCIVTPQSSEPTH